MPYKIKKNGSKFRVINSSTGESVGEHPSRKKALRHMAALYENVDDAPKSFNPAEHRVPGGQGPGAGGGRFAPGSVTDRTRPNTTTSPRNAFVPVRGPGGGGGGGGGGAGEGGAAAAEHSGGPVTDHQEKRIREAARKDIEQAKEIEAQATMLRAQIKWDRAEIAFQSGAGPAPATASPGAGRTQGAAGNVGSGAVPGATSGASASRFSNNPSRSTSAYIQFLQQDISDLKSQVHQLDAQSEGLHDRAHALLASIRGKGHPDAEITITAGALFSLIESYNQL